MISIVVVGARGYTGAELLPLLWEHPEFELVAVGSGSVAGQPLNAHVAAWKAVNFSFLEIRPVTMEHFPADACVLALPNGFASGLLPRWTNASRIPWLWISVPTIVLILPGHTVSPSDFQT